ncbi:GNAT family N-acetyltransferase [Desulforhopalus sp. IMCC35007]|uniref:GNAT family N-acetyltransferase n=1 Tax=Desulforhopalus sp. IMCC35007 TaxID=2569543 RepID=UPI0010AECEDE|nr:GNAT family N-acetyltransferase [Desulforhopalus sp. IMCC35007]TKB07411.1 GNAT family N-acetyltransferase [Desulforhopalus sp. IMCC35007]
MYQFYIISELDELKSVGKRWSELLTNVNFNSFFCTYEWITCWWHSFAKEDDRFAVVIGKKGNTIVAIAPLMIRKSSEYGFRLNILKFIGVPNSDRCDILIQQGENEIIPFLFSFIKKNLKGWDQFHLNEIPVESLFGKWLTVNCSMVFVEEGSECPYVPLGKWINWDEFYKSLSKKTRLELNNKNNTLRKEGNSQYHHCTNPNQNDPNLVIIRELERKSAKAQNITTENLTMVAEQQWEFQQKILNNCGCYQVLLAWLEREGEIIAYLYGYIYKNIYYAYNTAYSGACAKYSPGKLIINETLRYCKDNDIEEFDLLRGATHLKSRWTKHSRKQQNVYFLRNKPINWLYIFAVFRLRPLIKRLVLTSFGRKIQR